MCNETVSTVKKNLHTKETMKNQPDEILIWRFFAKKSARKFLQVIFLVIGSYCILAPWI